ncbi:gp16 family protein [Litorisediminicola beolgyonensis]|uniref:Gp16 family protein n=1 Tax=Litorisediminicola beolgyonensis TaxID=1173614 RepID=A0ABW3ZIA8_9RHOB
MTRALQKLVHVGCRELGLDAEARRDLQLAATGKASMRDMTEAELELVVARLKASGFKPQVGARPTRRGAPRADLRLIHVLWKKLGEAGQLRDPSRAGLNAFIRKRFGPVWQVVPADVDMLREHIQIDDVIQALTAWGRRSAIDFDWEEHRS